MILRFVKTGVDVPWHWLNERLQEERARWALWAPVALGLGIAAYFNLGFEPSLNAAHWALASGLCFGLIGLLLWRLPVVVSTLVIALSLSAIGFALAKYRTEQVRAPVITRDLEAVTLEGRLLEIRAGNDGQARLIISPDWIAGLKRAQMPEKVRLSYRYDITGFAPGDQLKLRASIMPPPEPVSPRGFDFARASWFDGIGGLGFTFGRATVVPPEGKESLARVFRMRVNAVRVRLATHIRGRVEGPAGAMAAALITGDRSGIAPEDTQALRDASLAHLLAISGLHMGLAGWALYSIARFLLVLVPTFALHLPVKKIAASVGIVGASVYLMISGSPVSAQRAYIMLSMVLIAIILDRPAFTLRMVALAATVILVIQPESLLSAGFQMSFAACTGLVAAHEARREWLAKRDRVNYRPFDNSKGPVRAYVNRLPLRSWDYFKGLAFTSFLAGLATAPFAAYHFNQFANFGLLANLLAVPFMGLIIMPMAVLGLLAMPLGLDAPFFKVMGMGIDTVLVIAHWIADMPQAVSHVSTWPPMAFGAIVVGGLWLCLWRQTWRRIGLAAILIGVIVGERAAPPDLVVDREAENIAVLASGGELVVMSKRKKFAANSWSRRSGQGPEYTPPEEGFSCDIVGCVYEEVGRPIVAYVADGRAFEDDCQFADILISQEPIPHGCNGPTLMIDGFDVRENGAYAIWFDGEGKHRVQTSKQVRGNRPWVAGSS